MEEITKTRGHYLKLIPGGSPLEQEAYYIHKTMKAYGVRTYEYIISEASPKIDDGKIYSKVVDAQDVAYAVHRLRRGDGEYIYFHIGEKQVNLLRED